MDEAPLVRGKRAVPKVEITLVSRRMRMYAISEDELTAIAENGNVNAVHMAFLGITAGAFLTLLVTLLTVNLDPWKYATFFMLTWGTGIAAIAFLVRIYFDRRALKKKLRALCEAN